MVVRRDKARGLSRCTQIGVEKSEESGCCGKLFKVEPYLVFITAIGRRYAVSVLSAHVVAEMTVNAGLLTVIVNEGNLLLRRPSWCNVAVEQRDYPAYEAK